MSKYDWGITLGLAGGTIGAAGWIFGAAIELAADPSDSVGTLDILVVLLGAMGVMLTGFLLWCLYLSRRKISVFFVIEALLGASLVFGTLAILWMQRAECWLLQSEDVPRMANPGTRFGKQSVVTSGQKSYTQSR